MAAKDIRFSEDARGRVLRGVNLLADAVLRNHTPINNEANFTGANLFTIDKPIGDKHNSPKVWIVYKLTNQIILTLIPGAKPFTPKAITK